MRIVSLQAQNIKRLKAVEITPTENTVIISGRNGMGKSSVLDSIWLALSGADAAKVTTRPIRDGEKRAQVKLDLGDLVVTRRWSSNDVSTLKVENKDGAVYKSPQKLLDDLVGRLSFDPLAFAMLPEKEQLKTLLELVELPVKPEELDAKKKVLYDTRTLWNRDIKQLEGQIAGIPKYPADTPEEEINASEVMADVKAAQDIKATNDNSRWTLKRRQNDVESETAALNILKAEIEDTVRRYKERLRRNSDATAELSTLSQQVSALVDPDLDAIQEKFATIEETNKNVRSRKQLLELQDNLIVTKEKSESFTTQIEAIDQQKEAMLKAAKFPVDGLGFDEDGVTYRDIPFKQCSSAERLRVSLAMAMALNPKLRVIRITDGSLLDSDNMRLIQEMAVDQDFQCWIEKVDDTGKVGIYVEDGEIKEAKEIETPNQKSA